MSSKSLGTLTLDLVAQTGGFVQGMDKAERSSKKWRKEVEGNLKQTSKQLKKGLKVSAAAAGAAIGALTAKTILMTRSGLQGIDTQNKLARSLDTTFDSVTALQLAFSENGIDGFEASMARLNRRLGAAELGRGSAVKAVEELNLNLREMAGLEADERLAVIADRIREVSANSAQAARYAQDLGFEQREAAQMFMQGGDAIRAYRQQVEDFGLAVSAVDAIKVEQANDAFARTGLIFDAISQQLAIQVAPILSAVSEMFTQNAKDAGGVGEATADAFNMIIEGGSEAVNRLAVLNRWFLKGQAAVDVFALHVRNGFLEIAREIVEIPTGAVNELINLLNKVGAGIEPLGLSTIGREVQSLIDGTNDEIRTINDTLREELAKPLPGDQFKRFVFEAQQAAEESAQAMAKIQEDMNRSAGLGGSGVADVTDDLQRRRDAVRQSFETEKQTILRIFGEQEAEIKALREAGALSKIEYDQLMWQNEQAMFEKRRELRQKELDEQRGYWGKWLEAAESNLQNFDELSKTVIDNFTTGFGSAIEGLVFDAESLDDALKGVAETILRNVVNSLAQMAAQWLALQAVQAVVGSSATAATVGQAAIAGAAWAPAAAAASLATLGTNAAPAATALTTTHALSKSMSIAGMAHDGMDKIPSEGTWLLDRGERVVSAPQADKLDAFLASQQNGGGGANITVNLYEDNSKAGTVEQSQRPDGGTDVNVFVSDIMSGGQRSKALESAYGLRRQGR